MIREDIKQLKTEPRDLRKFGLLVGAVFCVLGLVAWLKHKPYFPYLLAPGVALVVLGLLLPKTLKQVYIGWMSAAIVLGFLVSNVVLALFFFLVMTPIGLIARLAGKDFLGLKIRRDVPSYWIRRQPTARAKSDYERQF